MALPRPDGPHLVGTTDHTLLDTTRPRHLQDDTPGRRLQLKLWYPAASAGTGAPERVWEALRHDHRTPGPMRLLLGLIRAQTAARPGAPLGLPDKPPGLVVYQHGMVSFAAENSSLMECLASHGYLVIAIAHHDQLEEFRQMQRTQPAAQRLDASRLARQLARGDAASRAALASRYYMASPVTNRIVMERATDTAFVLQQIEDLLTALPYDARHPASQRGAALLAARLHLVGFSAGGAVATTVALRDARVRTVVNLDGGTQGAVDATAVGARYLMLYSAANAGINDTLLPAHALLEAPPGTRHLNYHDVAGLVPALRVTPALGSVHPGEFLQQRNQRVLRFLTAPPTAR